MAGVLATTGCAISPSARVDPELGFVLPGEWSSVPSHEAVLGPWWRELDDPRLETLIGEALRANHDLAEAAARIETAVAEARVAGAEIKPVLDVTLDAQRQSQTVFGTGTSNSFGASLNFRWEVDLWGRLRSRARAAVADLEEERALFRAAALSLTAQTSKAWFAVLEARQQVRLVEETVASYRATARQARNRVDAGIQSPVDRHLADANLTSAEASLQDRRERLDRAKRQLEVLLGRYPAAAVEAAAALPKVPGPAPAGIPADLIRRRPDLAASERRLAAARDRTGAARAALYPRLSLTASGGRTSAELEDLLSGDFWVWSIAGNLVQPIFEGGRLRAEVDAAHGRTRGAAAAFAQATLDALFEVEAALAAEAFLAERERALAGSAGAAGRAVAVSQNRYGQGVETLLTVLESQRRALDAESALLAVRRARLDLRVDLHLALGGGFHVLPSESLAAREATGEAPGEESR